MLSMLGRPTGVLLPAGRPQMGLKPGVWGQGGDPGRSTSEPDVVVEGLPAALERCCCLALLSACCWSASAASSSGMFRWLWSGTLRSDTECAKKQTLLLHFAPFWHSWVRYLRGAGAETSL